jgi:hypothetical protein
MAGKSPTQEFEKLKLAAVQARLPFEREAWLNLAFYLNEQYVEWNRTRGRSGASRARPRPTNIPRPVVNKIMHFVQQERAMVLQAKPTVDVMPATDDIMDITNAASPRRTARSWPSRSRPTSRASSRAPCCGRSSPATATSSGSGTPARSGPHRALLAVRDRPDPYAKDFSKARYVIHSKFLDREQVQEMYGVELPRTGTENADPMRVELLRGMGSAPVVNGVTVNELWYKPCKKYPDGLYAVWAGNELVARPARCPTRTSACRSRRSAASSARTRSTT